MPVYYKRLMAHEKKEVFHNQGNTSNTASKRLLSINDLGLDSWWGPLVTHTPFFVEVLLECQAVLEDLIFWSPVLKAILENESDIRLKLCRVCVLIPVHLFFDFAQAHGMFNDIEIAGAIMSDWIDRIFEWTNKTRPEARTRKHAADKLPTIGHVQIWIHFGGVFWTRALSGSFAVNAATRLRAASCLLNDRLDFEFLIRSAIRDARIGFTCAFVWTRWFDIDFDRARMDDWLGNVIGHHGG